MAAIAAVVDVDEALEATAFIMDKAVDTDKLEAETEEEANKDDEDDDDDDDDDDEDEEDEEDDDEEDDDRDDESGMPIEVAAVVETCINGFLGGVTGEVSGCGGKVIVGLLKPTLAVRWAAALKLLLNILVASTNSRFRTPPEATPTEAVMAVSHGRTVPSIVGALSPLRLLLLLSASSQPSAMSVEHSYSKDY